MLFQKGKLSQHSHVLAAAEFRRNEGRKTGSYLDAVIAYKEMRLPDSEGTVHFETFTMLYHGSVSLAKGSSGCCISCKCRH
jgi:hypothetical protein